MRLKARGLTTHPELELQEVVRGAVAEPIMTQDVTFADVDSAMNSDVPVYERQSLCAGMRLAGPAIITQYDTTTVVPPMWSVQIDAIGNLIIEQVEE